MSAGFLPVLVLAATLLERWDRQHYLDCALAIGRMEASGGVLDYVYGASDYQKYFLFKYIVISADVEMNQAAIQDEYGKARAAVLLDDRRNVGELAKKCATEAVLSELPTLAVEAKLLTKNWR